ncbi:MAG: filamentous hemagglutinin N-terminal domain-containing protein, partial [Chlamydiae bacterium]|nr:filamentous hemagglutinin N-terminal domain-containing protein [Chlamydiota bacterium]
MKNLYSVLFCSSMICCSLIAAPQDVVVESGQVSVRHETPHHMIMEVSDQAILSYQSFDIAKGEKVQFIQPSPSSSVLNRVRGGKMSEIMGSLESNGKVFLVNPRGIYFGKDAVVRVGSLVASTLQMANEDFLAGRYLFHLQEERARICNEGQIYAEGSIALISSSVSNQGLLVSQHGTVALASGEHVTLTFEGDDLLQFAVEGETKDALIEQAGVIQALEGRVWMKMATAKKTIQEVVNRSGIEVGEVFVHEGGEIFLVSASAILAKKVHIEAPSLEVAGKIDVSSGQGQGGDIALSGGMILLQRAHVDASGELGGGNVCIDAQVVQMDKDSCISVDASFSGSGGNVLLNAEKMMTFQGQVYARGGRKMGDGGFVESSSKRGLMIDGARVDTSAFSGHMGLWLLDPVTLTIGATGGGLPTGCFLADAQIDVTTLESASSSVFLCADTIIQEVPIAMINPGAGLTFST